MTALRTLTLGGCVLCALLATTPTSAQVDPPRIFGPTLAALAQPRMNDAATIQTRVVRPDFAAIKAIARRHLDTGQRHRFVLDLFDDVELVAEVISAEVRPTGVSLYAHLEASELGSALLTYERGVLIGSATLPGGHYTIEQDSDDRYRVARRGKFPRESPPRRVFVQQQPIDQLTDADVPLDSGRLIDVMVVWTPAARAAAGGTPQIQAIVQAAMDSSNLVYLNSGVAQRVRLVHSEEIDYAERSSCPGMFATPGTDRHECALIDATRNSDGLMDSVHSLRDTHGADLVGVLIDGPDSCGLSWLGDPPTPAMAAYAFWVTHWNCAAAGRSAVHEMGHNMGAHHDWYVLASGSCPDGKEAGAFCYSRGMLNVFERWMTVMAYPDACEAQAVFDCGRIDYLSTAHLAHFGTGIGNDQVTNTHTLNKTAKAVANYRPTSALHPVPQRFPDVLMNNPFFGSIEFLAQAAITGGCAGGLYCPDATVTRNQMAVFLIRSLKASNWLPWHNVYPLFTDVPWDDPFRRHVEALFSLGITSGCGPGLFCPNSPVTRGQMAVFVIRTACGSTFAPPVPATPTFVDVPPSHPFYAFIEYMYALGVTGGCATNPLAYCPESGVLRNQMAAFIERIYPYRHPTEACP